MISILSAMSLTTLFVILNDNVHSNAAACHCMLSSCFALSCFTLKGSLNNEREQSNISHLYSLSCSLFLEKFSLLIVKFVFHWCFGLDEETSGLGLKMTMYFVIIMLAAILEAYFHDKSIFDMSVTLIFDSFLNFICYKKSCRLIVKTFGFDRIVVETLTFYFIHSIWARAIRFVRASWKSFTKALEFFKDVLTLTFYFIHSIWARAIRFVRTSWKSFTKALEFFKDVWSTKGLTGYVEETFLDIESPPSSHLGFLLFSRSSNISRRVRSRLPCLVESDIEWSMV